MKVEQKKELDAFLATSSQDSAKLAEDNSAKIRTLARIRKLAFVSALPTDRVLFKGVSRLGTIGLDLEGAIDIDAERERLQKEMNRIRAEIERISRKIGDEDFLTRAPESVVLENRARHSELLERFQKLESNMSSLRSP